MMNKKKLAIGIALSTTFLLYSSYKIYRCYCARNKIASKQYFITEDQAVFRRSQLLKNKDKYFIDYSICLKLIPGDSYQGAISMIFHTKYPLEEDIFLDYQGESIEEIIISGHKLISKNKYRDFWDGHRLRLPKNLLTGGKNLITIFFSNKYSNSGNGLQSVVDSVDKRQYLYSQCEPDHMRRVIPCFDQPDIKGKFKLILIIPKEWIGISNESIVKTQDFSPESFKSILNQNSLSFREEFINGVTPQTSLLEFEATEIISTYLFSVIAGPYCEYRCEETYKNIPMSFYCRESLYKDLKTQVDELLEITNLSMEFYENFFQTPFPFKKYDQIFCPEYSSGAMEHPGAVTINDTYIFKDKVNPDSITFRAITISHELSHMWFGNLVTMTWWDDLWLNESFAEFFSHFCLSHVALKKVNADFDIAFFSSKGGAYRCDQMRTSHPVSGKIRNTEETRTVFDGITYCKGAAILKQIMFIVGEKPFSRALKEYFSKYKWDNAKLSDFFSLLQNETQKEGSLVILDENWKSEWLNTAGLNECMISSWGKNEETQEEEPYFKILQTPALIDFPTLRKHKMKLAFFLSNGKIGEIREIVLEGPETIVNYDATKDFVAVLPNFDDHSYIKLVLDPISVKNFTSILKKIEHGLSRSMIWRAFYDMVRDGKLSSCEYAAIFNENIEYEDNENLLNDIFVYADFNFSWSPKNAYENLGRILFQKTLSLLTNPKYSESSLLIFKSFLVKFAYHEDDIHILYQWYNGKYESLKNQEISIYNGWDILKAIYRSKRYSIQEKQELFKEQCLKDPTEKKYMEKTFEGMIANNIKKKDLWQSYLKETNEESIQLIAYSMEGFNDLFSDNLEQFQDAYFSALVKIFRTRNLEFAKTFAWTLFPNSQDLVYLKKKLLEVLEKTNDNDISLKKFLREQIDLNERKAKSFGCFYRYEKCLTK